MQVVLAETVLLVGQVSEGAVWSATVTRKVQVAVLLFASVAVSVTV